MNLNKIFVAGRLTKAPELKATPQGMSVATFSIATNSVWTDKSGTKKEEVEYHSIVVWGKQAESVTRYLEKGQIALIEGRIKTRSWKNQQDQTVKATEIIAERIQFGQRAKDIGMPRDEGIQNHSSELEQEAAQAELPQIDIDEDIKPEDLPF